MSRFFFTGLALALSLVALLGSASCSRGRGENELAKLDRETNVLMSSITGSGPDSLAGVLLTKAEKNHNSYYIGKAHLYLSHCRIGLDSATVSNKMAHLDMAEKIAEETGNDTLLSQVYNMRGVWEMSENLAPVTAQYWFNKSIETATPLGERWISIPAEMNMSEASRLTGDTIGIKYELNLFDYANKSGNKDLQVASGLHFALYYARIANDTAVLGPYVKAIEELPEISQSIKGMIYATFYYNRGDYVRAAEFMKKSNPEKYNDFSIFYAEILSLLGHYDESDSWLDKVSDDNDVGLVYSYNEQKAIQVRARNAAAGKRWEEAFLLQRKLERVRDSIDVLNVKDLSRRYQVEYEVNLKDREISDQQQRMQRLRTGLYWTMAFIVAVTGGFLIYTWKRRRLYREIVRKNLDFMDRQHEMEFQMKDLESKIKSSDTTLHTSGTTKIQISTIDGVFAKIKKLVEEREVWRDGSLSRDTLSEMAGCNRTYVTEAVKVHTGMSYTQYINSFRIREAIRVLSDPKDETQLKDLSPKLGFLTVASFYSSFKKETGLSPAAFRKTAHDIAAEDSGVKDDNFDVME